MLSVSSPEKKQWRPRVYDYRDKNPNGHVRAFLETIRKVNRPLPDSSAELLRNPGLFFKAVTTFDSTAEGRFLESLVENNILAGEDDSTQSLFVSYVNAAQVGALYHSLANEDKTKFYNIVKAFDLAIQADPRLKESMTDMVIEGGEIRVASSASAVMAINALTKLLGVQLTNFYGASAGAFLALGQAVKAPNSAVFANCADTQFETFHGNRNNLLDWLNFLASEGYSFNTGKHVDKIKMSHLEELGTNFQSFVSERTSGNFMWPFTFRTEEYFLPQAFEPNFGDTTNYDLASLAAMSANLVCFFFWPWDTTFGDCYYNSPDGEQRYIVDPGTQHANMLPLQGLEAKIKAHVQQIETGQGTDEPLPFGFVVKNKAAHKKDFPKADYRKLIGELRDLNMVSGFRRVLMMGFDVFSALLDINQQEPWDRIKEVGLEAATIESRCVTRSLEDGRLQAMLNGFLKTQEGAKESIICAQLPTKEYAESRFRDPSIERSTIDQLYDQFVDERYVESNGEEGRSPFEIYRDGIYAAHKLQLPPTDIEIPSPAQSVLIARRMLETEMA